MEISQLIENIKTIGINIVLDGDSLHVRGDNEPLPDDFRQAIRNNRDAIISRLRTEASPPEADASQTGPAAEPPQPQPAESELEPADVPPPESRTPPSPIGQAREQCARCSGSWYYPASGGWVCGMCVARKAAAGATTPAPGLTSCLLDFVDTLAVADPEGAITGRDLIEVFAPYQHARGMRPSPPREVWGALERLDYKVRGEDTLQPLIMGLRLVLGEEG